MSAKQIIEKFARGRSWDEAAEIRQVGAIAEWQATLKAKSPDPVAREAFIRMRVRTEILKSFRYPGSRCATPIQYVQFDETTRTGVAKADQDA